LKTELWGIFRLEREEVMGTFRILQNEEFHTLYISQNMIRVIKPGLGWTGHLELIRK
jgi:hypothetical protein